MQKSKRHARQNLCEFDIPRSTFIIHKDSGTENFVSPSVRQENSRVANCSNIFRYSFIFVILKKQDCIVRDSGDSAFSFKY